MPASNQDLAVAVASMEASMRAMQEIFNAHTAQDMQQFEALNHSIESLDEKLDQLLLREAHRSGEFSALRRTALALAFMISTVVSIGAAAVQAFVG